MRIYVASLSDYNAGILHGFWFDLSDYSDADDLLEAIQKQVLDTSPTAHEEGLESAEEFAIHDYDDVYPAGLGEYESINRLMEIQDCLNRCIDDNIPEEAFCEWMEEKEGVYSKNIDYDNFASCYKGHYDSEVDFTYELVHETCLLDDVPEIAARYFDYEAYARDLFINDYTMTSRGYVFSYD